MTNWIKTYLHQQVRRYAAHSVRSNLIGGGERQCSYLFESREKVTWKDLK